MNKSTYFVKPGDILRTGGDDGWIRVDDFNGDLFTVTPMDYSEELGDMIPSGESHLMTQYDMCYCVHVETGRTYARVSVDTSDLPPIYTVDSFGGNCPENWEEIADALNEKVNKLGIYFDRDAQDELWEEYWDGELPDTPVPKE